MRKSTPCAGRALARGLALAPILAAAVACRGGSPGGEGSSTGGAATSESTAAVGTTFATPDACMLSDDCETSGHCIAPYDPAPDEGSAMRGPAACVDACIEEDDLQRWCLDDEACCGELRCNAVDGFCEGPLPSGSSGATGSGTGIATGSGSGSESGTTGSSSDAGSSGAAGSSTGNGSSGSTG